MSQTLRERWEAIYRQAEYRVLLDSGPLSLRIGEYDAQGEHRLLAATAFKRECCILTACNPHSTATSEALNQRANQQLREQIAAQGLRCFPTLNIDPAGNWPDEPGFLIVDADQDGVLRLGQRFGQNAIVAIAPGQAPKLIWLASF